MYYKKSNRSNTSQHLSDVLSRIVNRPALRTGIFETRVIKAWPTVMGPAVARITTQLYFNKGYLNVSLNSSVIRSELIMHKDTIIEKLNAEVGGKAVYDIVFR